MATSTTSHQFHLPEWFPHLRAVAQYVASALKSGAAKDDALVADGDFTFTIADLLANDPGGAAKNKHFLFGTTQADWNDQKGYLEAHGIIALPDGITFAINPDGIDFQYVLKIGKGIWSTANVDVTAPLPPPHPPSIPSPHAGDLLFQDNFDDYLPPGTLGSARVQLGAKWSGNYTESRLNVGPSLFHPDDLGYTWTGPEPTSGNYWLDTVASDHRPGGGGVPIGINISSGFTDPTGGKFLLEFDIATVVHGHPTKMMSPDAAFEIRIGQEGSAQEVVKSFGMSDFPVPNVMNHVSLVVDLGKPDGAPVDYKISLVDTTPEVSVIGFAIDTIQIHDWIT